MEYTIKAESIANQTGKIVIKKSNLAFGITAQDHMLPNPAEVFLSSLAACILKNVARFSSMMRFTYEKAEIEINATRSNKPPRMDELRYQLTIFSNDTPINLRLLKKNIEKFGTIYNTIQASCSIEGDVKLLSV